MPTSPPPTRPLALALVTACILSSCDSPEHAGASGEPDSAPKAAVGTPDSAHGDASDTARSDLPTAAEPPLYQSDDPTPTRLLYRNDSWTLTDGPRTLEAPSDSVLAQALTQVRQEDIEKGIRSEVVISVPASCSGDLTMKKYVLCHHAGIERLTVLARTSAGQEAPVRLPIDRVNALLETATGNCQPLNVRAWPDGRVTVLADGKQTVVSSSLDDHELPGLDQVIEEYIARRNLTKNKFASALVFAFEDFEKQIVPHQRLVDILVRLSHHGIAHVHTGTAEDPGITLVDEEPEPALTPPRNRIIPLPVPPRTPRPAPRVP